MYTFNYLIQKQINLSDINAIFVCIKSNCDRSFNSFINNVILDLLDS